MKKERIKQKWKRRKRLTLIEASYLSVGLNPPDNPDEPMPEEVKYMLGLYHYAVETGEISIIPQGN